MLTEIITGSAAIVFLNLLEEELWDQGKSQIAKSLKKRWEAKKLLSEARAKASRYYAFKYSHLPDELQYDFKELKTHIPELIKLAYAYVSADEASRNEKKKLYFETGISYSGAESEEQKQAVVAFLDIEADLIREYFIDKVTIEERIYISSQLEYVVDKYEHRFNSQDERLSNLENIILHRDSRVFNQDYYYFLKSYTMPLFLHQRCPVEKQVTLEDTYIEPPFSVQYSNNEKLKKIGKELGLFQLIEAFASDEVNESFLLIEGDGGTGKSTLLADMAYNCIDNSFNKGVLKERELLYVMLRRITDQEQFVLNPVAGILHRLGVESILELEKKAPKSILILDGFDELCMIDGISDKAEEILGIISKAFTTSKIIVTTRPKFIYMPDLRQHIRYEEILYVVLKHFDLSKRTEWVEKYRNCTDDENSEQLKRILDIQDDEASGICDTPLSLYMLAAGRFTEEAWNNPWTLYHQIFTVELSATDYNLIFNEGKPAGSHTISKMQSLIDQTVQDIAYKMYTTGNSKLYVDQNDLEIIISKVVKANVSKVELIKRCFALCSYWKIDSGYGFAEFYHNNIRDFFLAEKVYREFLSAGRLFDEECARNEEKRVPKIYKFIEKIGDLFRFGELNEMVCKFIYYRALDEKKSRTEDTYVQLEMKFQFIGFIFQEMFIHGAIPSFVNDGSRNLLEENLSVLRCVTQFYRHLYEPYVVSSKRRIEWFFNAGTEMNSVEALTYLFKPVFIRTPVQLDYDYHIYMGAYANWNLFELKNADLSNGGFQHSSFRHCDFTNSNLKGADFKDADLSNCKFRNVDMSYVKLEGANLEGAVFEDAITTHMTLPDGKEITSDEDLKQFVEITNHV